MSSEEKYGQMLHLPHHVSSRHVHMSRLDRAAQFSPFAALTGYDSVITETGRLTDVRIELDEERKSMLNGRLRRILAVLHTFPEITVTHFCPDTKKSGGAYLSTTGKVKKIDPYEHTLVLTDRTVIPIDQIYELEGELFRQAE